MLETKLQQAARVEEVLQILRNNVATVTESGRTKFGQLAKLGEAVVSPPPPPPPSYSFFVSYSISSIQKIKSFIARHRNGSFVNSWALVKEYH